MRLAGWGAGLAIAALLLVGAGWGMLHPQGTPASDLIGRPAPPLVVRAFDGSTVSLAGLRGRPVVLNFWASWCAPCRQEDPSLQQAARDHATVAFVGVAFKDSSSAARAYADETHHPYPLGEAVSGDVGHYGVTGPPETFFIDANGLVAARFVGPVDGGVMARYLQLVGAA
jgi:cytochrome c biogenesis protein CcmG/thiol:disulfide interchange protein DsbE